MMFDPRIVAQLETLLEEARSGRIEGIAFAAKAPNEKEVLRGFVGVHTLAMVGALFEITVALAIETRKADARS